MNIHYRIVRVDPAAHGIVIRYFTDNVTEVDLANSFNEDGSVRVNADGYPLTTRTDVFMSIYDIPAPTFDQIEKMIKLAQEQNAQKTSLSYRPNIEDLQESEGSS